ncbi:unnamed protein product [Sphacelaria rigidula]
MVTEPYQRMHAEGKAIHAILFGSILDWCIELFALVGLISLTSRLLSAWLLGVAILTAIPLIGTLFVLDRRIFAYRAVVSDDGVASVVVICTFFASVSFIALFLGLESIHEGITAGQDVSAWVNSMLDDENNKAEWNQIMARLTDFAQETARGLGSRYNGTVWFPAAYNAVMQYMEHVDVAIDVDSLVDDPTAAATAVGGLMSGEGLSGLLGALRERVSNLDISMDHVINYGAPSGEAIATGAMYVAAFGSFLVTVGFKVVLFFTCLLYLTINDTFLERTFGDLLPVPQKDRQAAVDMLRGAIQGVFFLPCKVACLHGMVTLLSFTLLNIEFPFFAAFVAVVVSILPVVPAYVVCWPWAVALILQGRWVGIILAVSQNIIFGAVDTELCTQASLALFGIQEANPYLTGLSSFLGFAVFGAQGALVGPLIICSATLVFRGLGFLESLRARVNADIKVASTSSKSGAGDDCAIGEGDNTACGCSPAKDGAQSRKLQGLSTFERRIRVTLRLKARKRLEQAQYSIFQAFQPMKLSSSFRCFVIFYHISLQESCSAPANKEPAGSDEQNSRLCSTPRMCSTWRFDIAQSFTWDEFLLEVQDVTGVDGISGVYDQDGSRIQRVEFIDNGEILDVVTGKEQKDARTPDERRKSRRYYVS